MSLKLVIGNKNYSSWSMRPWLAMKATDLPFEEIQIPLYTGPADKQRILDFSASGKVPILVDGGITVWDSLAILEYLAERFPNAALWPADAAMRAHARSISAEMHSGFGPLRQECGMNIHRPLGGKVLSADAKANIARIDQIWTDCRRQYAQGGPFLFGRFTAADAMYAPIVHRFRTYAIEIGPEARAYMQTMLEFPPFRVWMDAALAETLVIAKFEND